MLGIPSEEVVPGVTLDGSIVIDESIWLRLVGEPGRHMQNAHDCLKKKQYREAQESLRSAASFLYIAHGNASKPAEAALMRSARELDRLADNVSRGAIPSIGELRPVFARAHHALARHHAIKSAAALPDTHYETAGSYLGSSLNHFQRADWWDLALQPDSVQPK